MATSYNPSKDALSNTIRNSMFRSGVVGQSLKQSYEKITDQEVVDILTNQVTALQENNTTLSSIDTIARRISNNVFALAKFMQKQYEQKLREKMLRDRERSRQEASQEEARFEPIQGEDREEKRAARQKTNKSDLLTVAARIIALGSLITLGFKNEVEQFIKKAENWFDETFESSKRTFITLIDDARDNIDQALDGYIDESSEEVKLNREEDIESERIISDITNALEEEDGRIDAALGLEPEEERDISDIVVREPLTPNLSEPLDIGLQPDYTTPAAPPELKPPVVEPLTPTTTSYEQPTPTTNIVANNIPTDLSPVLTSPPTRTNDSVDTIQPSTSYAPRPLTPTTTSPSLNLPSALTEIVSTPPMLARSSMNMMTSPAPTSTSGAPRSFGDFIASEPSLSLSTPAQMSTFDRSDIRENMPQTGKVIGETSFTNRAARQYSQVAQNNTSMITTNNTDALKPQAEHFVPSPIANRGSLEIGVRFNATN